MITIISGSNRKDNNTKKIAQAYQLLLTEKNIDSQILALDEINLTERETVFIEAEEKFLVAAQKFIIVMPEYNGSYPGILKLMIDNTDVAKCWWHKKVLLTGVATGRAGNLRGMEHLTGSLLHMKMLVHPNRLPISLVNKVLDSEGKINDDITMNAIQIQIEEFLAF